MESKKRGVSQNCGCDLARPYVNDQTFTKMYNLSTALKYGTEKRKSMKIEYLFD